jgi:hypothetical protein
MIINQQSLVEQYSLLDPDTIVVGAYYVARRPTLEEQKQPYPSGLVWGHEKIANTALECVSVGARGEVKLAHPDGGSENYSYKLLRGATGAQSRNARNNKNNKKRLAAEDGARECSIERLRGAEKIIEPESLSASEVLGDVTAEHYRDAALVVAQRKAQAEINQQAMTPGMIVYHTFKHYPCILIGEASDGTWTVETENGKRESDVNVSILTPIVPGKAARFLAAYKRDSRFRGLVVMFSLLGAGLTALGVAALTTLAVTGSLTF